MELKKYLINLFKRTIIALILFFLLGFLLKNDSFYYRYKDIIFSSNIDFSYIKSKTKYLFGNILDDKEHYVISEKLKYYQIKEVDGSYILEVDHNYVINNICSGVVVYLGIYDSSLGRSIVIEGDDGITYIYSNIENINVNIYDYVKKGVPLGVAIENEIILTFKRGEEYINYEEVI